MAGYREGDARVERRIAVLNGVNPDLLDKADFVADVFNQIVQKDWALTVVAGPFAHPFEGNEDLHEEAATVLITFSESHGGVSTWPRRRVGPLQGQIQVDLSTCSTDPTLDRSFEAALIREFRPRTLRSSLILPREWDGEEIVRQRWYKQIAAASKELPHGSYRWVQQEPEDALRADWFGIVESGFEYQHIVPRPPLIISDGYYP